jgi:hypothetical protein
LDKLVVHQDNVNHAAVRRGPETPARVATAKGGYKLEVWHFRHLHLLWFAVNMGGFVAQDFL